MKILVDVWGGEDSTVHVARSFYAPGDFLNSYVESELKSGYLVNLRRADNDQVPWGPGNEFDSRIGKRELS